MSSDDSGQPDPQPARPSSIDLPEHDVEGADDGHNVGEHGAPRDSVEHGQMGEPGRSDLAPVGTVASPKRK